uniref:SOCS box domain-containing protein n=1 Tax=Sinocyclocheilus grahami TaxID=75366 RepID=A0A672MC89_SINGR
MSPCCLVDLSGRAVLILLDYVSRVPLCSRLRSNLEKQKEWEEIYTILSEFTGFTFNYLSHLCRLEIRKHMTIKRLCNTVIMDPFPPPIKNYLLYKEYDLT